MTERRPERLVGWLGLVGALIAINYAARATGGKPDRDILYQYSAAVGAFLEFAFILGIVLWLAGPTDRRGLLALRRPRSYWRAALLGLGVIVGIYLLSAALDPLLHPGREQGLTPSHWQPGHADAYAANFFVIAVFGPIVEELTFRGLGFGLIVPYGGQVLAILSTGILFGLAHGLVEALPLLAVFGIGLAILRSRTGSVYPGWSCTASSTGLR